MLANQRAVDLALFVLASYGATNVVVAGWLFAGKRDFSGIRISPSFGAPPSPVTVTSMILRSIGKTLLGKATPFQVRAAAALGGALGFTADLQRAPALTIGAPANGARFEPGSAVTIGGIATDLEDGSLSQSIEWRSSLDGLLGSGASVTRMDLREGTHRITATVTDRAGQTRTTSVTIVVAAPVVRIKTPADGSEFIPGEAIEFSATASLAGGDLSPSVSWTSHLDGPLGTGASVTRTDLSPGIHQIRATLTDSAGVTHQAQTT